MAAEFENIALLLLVLLAITCVLQVIFIGFLIWYLRKVAGMLGVPMRGGISTATPSGEVLQPVTPEPVKPGTAAMTPPVKAEILMDRRDIQGSIHSLSQKYDLSDFIISTLDGLVVVSLSAGSSDEAARFSDLFRRRKKPDTPGVTFLEIRHRGESMLGIIRADHPVGPDELKGIGEDAEKILNWWL